MKTHLTRRQWLSQAATLLSPNLHASIDNITPTDQFFRLLRPTPMVEVDYWSFTLGGLVRHPTVWSFADLQALPQTESACTLLCAAHTPQEPRVGHAVWQGVALAALLDTVEIDPAARHVRLSAADGHVTTLPLERLRTALLATMMNGAPLRPEHGYPARLIVPGLYDHKQPRWIQRADLTTDPTPGLWEQRGWAEVIAPTVGLIEPLQRTPVASPVRLRGFAYASDLPVEAVAISIDGGAFAPLDFAPAPPHTWVRWEADWHAPAPGDYRVTLRVQDTSGASGTVQQSIRVIDT
jgi:DMSO/TMAO reductase YedYZ molybdopterin-dependent catalytic subunit